MLTFKAVVNTSKVHVYLYGSLLGTCKVNHLDFYIDYSMDWVSINGISDIVHNEFRRLIKDQLVIEY